MRELPLHNNREMRTPRPPIANRQPLIVGRLQARIGESIPKCSPGRRASGSTVPDTPAFNSASGTACPIPSVQRRRIGLAAPDRTCRLN